MGVGLLPVYAAIEGLRNGTLVRVGGWAALVWRTEVVRTAEIKCGSGLACEGGVSDTDSLADPPHSRASPLPQVERCTRCMGVGLLPVYAAIEGLRNGTLVRGGGGRRSFGELR